MKLTVHSDERSWLAARRRRLTSSDVGPLLGVYPSEQSKARKNPFEIWRQKTGQAEEEDDSEMRLRYDLGHIVEPRLTEEVEEREGVRLADLGDYTTVEDGILLSTPDRMIVPEGFELPGLAPVGYSEGDASRETKALAILEAAEGAVELKSDGVIQEAKSWGKAGKFDYALVQLTVTMMVTGQTRGLIAACFGLGLGFEIYPVEINADLVSLIRERTEEFWESVLVGSPPPAKFLDDSKAIGKSLEAIYGKGSGELIVLDDDPEAARLQLEHYEEAKQKIKEWTARKSAIENAVKHRMKSASNAKVPGTGKRWQWRTEEKKEHVRKASKSRVLRLVND